MPFTFFNLIDPDTRVCRHTAGTTDEDDPAFLDPLTPTEQAALLEEATPLAHALCQAIAAYGTAGTPIRTAVILEALELVIAHIEHAMDALDTEDCDA